jgi:malonyl-CoA/methylmalonyl-CoA synthetase
MGVPTYYARLVKETSLSKELCRHMRLFISGSAPLLPATFAEFQARTGHTLLERYGMTETGMIASNPLAGARKPGSVGPALPGVAVRIVDADGKILAPGEVGEVQVSGENVFSGYFRMPERKQDDFTPDGYFKTGDLGALDSDGYLSLVGRSKDLVITGGLNVYPKEIEQVLDGISGVAESAVIGLPHPDLGEGVVAVLVMKPGAPALSEAELKEKLQHQLAGFKLPKRWLTLPSLPRNAMGKVQKAELRKQFAGLFQPGK